MEEYNISSDYRVVVLRYPIDELITIGDVEKFFVNFIQQLSSQQKVNQNEVSDIVRKQ